MTEQIIIDITNQCSTQQFDFFGLDEEDTSDLVESMETDDVEIKKTLENFECIIKSVQDVVKGTKLVEITSQWEVTEKYLEVLYNRMNACKNIEDKSEQVE